MYSTSCRSVFSPALRHAWDRRGRSKELKTRGADGPIQFQLKYRERPGSPVITYALAIDEGSKGPVVVEESLRWRRQQYGNPFKFLEFRQWGGGCCQWGRTRMSKPSG